MLTYKLLFVLQDLMSHVTADILPRNPPLPPDATKSFESSCLWDIWGVEPIPDTPRKFRIFARCGAGKTNPVLWTKVDLDDCLGNSDGMLIPCRNCSMSKGCERCERMGDPDPAHRDWLSDEIFCWCLGAGDNPQWHFTYIKPGESAFHALWYSTDAYIDCYHLPGDFFVADTQGRLYCAENPTMPERPATNFTDAETIGTKCKGDWIVWWAEGRGQGWTIKAECDIPRCVHYYGSRNSYQFGELHECAHNQNGHLVPAGPNGGGSMDPTCHQCVSKRHPDRGVQSPEVFCWCQNAGGRHILSHLPVGRNIILSQLGEQQANDSI